MAVTHNNTSTAGRQTSVSSQTWSLTVNAGTDKLILVGISHSGPFNGTTVSSVVFNGSETLAIVPSSGVTQGSIRTELYYRVNPTVTTANVVVTMSNTTSVITSGAEVMDGVDQTEPLGTASTNSANPGSSPISLAPSGTSDGLALVIAGIDNNGSVTLTSTVGTSRWITTGSTSQEAAGATASGATPTCTWTYSGTSASWTVSGVSALATAAASVISFVGSAVGSSSPTTDTVINLTALTGGSNSSPTAGDLILVVAGVGDTADNGMPAPTEGGYTDVLGASDLYSDDVNDALLDLYYKYHVSDTAITFGDAGGSNASNAAVAMVFRGVASVADGGPFDTATAPATGISTSNADPPSINHSGAAGIWTVIAAVTGHTGTATATWTAPTGYTTDFTQRAHNDTIDVLVGMGYKTAPSDPEDPGALTAANIGTAADNAWCAVTMALKPAVATILPPRPTIINFAVTRAATY